MQDKFSNLIKDLNYFNTRILTVINHNFVYIILTISFTYHVTVNILMIIEND